MPKEIDKEQAAVPSVQDQIAQMLGGLDTKKEEPVVEDVSVVAEEEPAVEEPVAEEQEEEKDDEVVDVTPKEPVDEDTPVEDEVVDAEVDEGKEPEEEVVGEEGVFDPMVLAEEMAKNMSGGPVKDVKKEEKVTEPVAEQVDVTKPVVAELTVSDSEWQEAFDSAEKFNKNVMNKIGKYTETRVQESTRAALNTLMPAVNQAIEIRLAASDFYMANPDLRKAKTFVGMVANEVFAANPDKSIEECFNQTGEEVRKRLKVKKPTGGTSNMKVERSNKRKPVITDKRRRSSRKLEAPKLVGMQGEIAEMINHGNR